MKSFPDLSQVDEIQLNLDLASQYVELGAYDAAKALLGEQDENYSAEQRQRADQLLNQIASDSNLIKIKQSFLAAFFMMKKLR